MSALPAGPRRRRRDPGPQRTQRLSRARSHQAGDDPGRLHQSRGQFPLRQSGGTPAQDGLGAADRSRPNHALVRIGQRPGQFPMGSSRARDGNSPPKHGANRPPQRRRNGPHQRLSPPELPDGVGAQFRRRRSSWSGRRRRRRGSPLSKGDPESSPVMAVTDISARQPFVLQLPDRARFCGAGGVLPVAGRFVPWILQGFR
jgi:hypothetical protein